MSNSFELYPTHFSRGAQNFALGASAPCAHPGYGPGGSSINQNTI